MVVLVLLLMLYSVTASSSAGACASMLVLVGAGNSQLFVSPFCFLAKLLALTNGEKASKKE